MREAMSWGGGEVERDMGKKRKAEDAVQNEK
jgi:hypothetical protein